MKAIIIFAIAVMLLVSCEKENTILPKDNLQLVNSYFPLEVGNEWKYLIQSHNDTSYLTVQITGIKSINGSEYFVIEANRKFLVTNDSILYIRTTDNIHYYNFRNNQECINFIYKDTTLNYNEYPSFLESKLQINSTVNTTIGKFEDIYLLSYGLGTEPIYCYYANGIGLVKQVWFKGGCELVYAKVNGKIIGE